MPAKLFKLISGEEIVCSTEEDKTNKDRILLVKPVRVAILPNGGAAFVPFPLSLFSDNEKDEYSILKSHIMIEAVPAKELANEYNSKVGSGIVLA
jgi:hypothetical protein